MTAIYRFGRVELNPATREVLVDNQPAPLGARAFDVLLALIERRDRLVTKNELLDLVWPGLVVEENNLQVQISALRKLLGADAIATVATRGYRFTLEPTPAAVLAPPSSQRPEHNLPAQTTQLIGREREMRGVREQLSKPHVRLLTLSGVGGTGKTRLALQVAADMMGEFEHGVCFVSLAALGDPALVVPTIAKTFGLRETAGHSMLEQLQDYLRDKQMLLVLDNFEQVIDAAPRVSELLTAAARLKVLVTSREALRLSGETDYPVPPLSLPDSKRLPSLAQLSQYEAVALFIERAVAVKPTFMVTNENAPAVAEICHRLDGLPLAIELAAARARVLPPERMLAELSQRLNFLTSGSRDVPARHKTLRGAIDWSHDLLTTAERQLFRRLGVFVGGCTLESIETVCNVDNDFNVLEIVESLIAKSLVKQTEADGELRFTMLETIREYARDKLTAAGDKERVRARHHGYYLGLAEEAEPKLLGAEQIEWLQRLEVEHENLRAALSWSLVAARSEGGLRLCGALLVFWDTRGYLSEGRAWCARVDERAESKERTAERAKMLNTAGHLALMQGDYPAARARHEESLAIRRQLGDQRGVAVSLNNLGNVSNEQADYDLARSLYEESLAIRRQLGHRGGIAISLSNLGLVARAQGDLLSARALHEESLAIMRELGGVAGIAASLCYLGMVVTEQGDYAAAQVLYKESLLIFRQLGDIVGTAWALEGLADVVAALGSPLRAARVWGAAERLRVEVGLALSPRVQPYYDRRVASARVALRDDAAFEHSWQDGRVLSIEQAIELALEKTVEQG